MLAAIATLHHRAKLTMKRLVQNLLAAVLGLFSAVYLLNPGWGVVEFITDALPVAGNIDEAAAVLILLRCLAHFGIDLSFLTHFRKPEREAESATPQRGTGRPREKVIDV